MLCRDKTQTLEQHGLSFIVGFAFVFTAVLDSFYSAVPTGFTPAHS
jgi:hypothetical protein